MNIQEKNKLNHDFKNSMVIINSLSKSCAVFIEKITDRDTSITENQMKLFKMSMTSIQQELAKIDGFFQIAMSS
mgnify:CR=1 FL=1